MKKNTDPQEYKDTNVLLLGVECLRDTNSAILVFFNGEEHWIPQSQIHEDSEVWKRGDKGKLIITKWIAKKRNLWDEEDED